MTLDIRTVPCRGDNYAYLVHAVDRDDAIVVDPSAAEPIAAALSRAGWTLGGVLCTHHHYDHVGGNEALLEACGAAPVYAHRTDRGRIPGQTDDVDDEEPFEVAGLSVRPLHVPGHTRGALAYCVGDAVFTGDTLFVAGCGRLFEGTAAELYHSLEAKLAPLAPATRVYCGHEYTKTNLRFAAEVEPGNQAVLRKLAWTEQQLARRAPTVPSSIREELETNPFLRCAVPALAARFGPGDGVTVFAALRRAKDAF